MKAKKILFLITKANWGGAQRYVFDLATALRNEFDISVAFGQEGLLAKKLREAQITTFPIRALQRDVSISSDVKSFLELMRLFRVEKPDVVHLNRESSSPLMVGLFRNSVTPFPAASSIYFHGSPPCFLTK